MQSTDPFYHEKRDFIRMKITSPLACSLRINGLQLEGLCNDLSANGLQVTLDQPLALGSEGEMILQSNFGHKPQLHVRVGVARVESAPDGKHIVGLAILEHLG